MVDNSSWDVWICFCIFNRPTLHVRRIRVGGVGGVGAGLRRYNYGVSYGAGGSHDDVGQFVASALGLWSGHGARIHELEFRVR